MDDTNRSPAEQQETVERIPELISVPVVQQNHVWNRLPEIVLLKIYSYLNLTELLRVRSICKNWSQSTFDNILWKNIFCQRFKVPFNKQTISTGEHLWEFEFKRIYFQTPSIESQCISTDPGDGHTDEVLHVSFSHNGQMFATTSKDCFFKVWGSSHPCQLLYSYNCEEFKWNYTRFCLFNNDDTLLLVSGVHMHSQEHYWESGEIAVYSLKNGEFNLQCRVYNNPYDIWGCWYDRDLLLSATLHMLEQAASCSLIWANKTCQEPEDNQTPVISRLFRFLNHRGTYARSLMIANVPANDDEHLQVMAKDHQLVGRSLDTLISEGSVTSSSASVPNRLDKYIIFTTERKANMTHQIGIKKLETIEDFGFTMAAYSEEGCRMLFDDENYENMHFDEIDHLFEMHGRIIGMALSPDHRYLYVNVRTWPNEYTIDDTLDLPIAQEIDIHVIDLVHFKDVGVLHRSHKAYTPIDECFLIFLDVCDQYVASGAEDKHGYLWDRHYGVCLTKFEHDNVVNSVAFNPKDSSMLVTVSDDFKIKIWRSREWRRIYSNPDPL